MTQPLFPSLVSFSYSHNLTEGSKFQDDTVDLVLRCNKLLTAASMSPHKLISGTESRHRNKVDRVLANHSLSSTASQGTSNIPLSLPSLTFWIVGTPSFPSL